MRIITVLLSLHRQVAVRLPVSITRSRDNRVVRASKVNSQASKVVKDNLVRVRSKADNSKANRQVSKAVNKVGKDSPSKGLNKVQVQDRAHNSKANRQVRKVPVRMDSKETESVRKQMGKANLGKNKVKALNLSKTVMAKVPATMITEMTLMR